ncbi:MAG: [citrate (pro-3S)-lyase] ligase [Ruminococcaceae bacterium]|nr:[citrate (pro-3S)-lyase] ligase [Oscillospiraceae bacterium]
MNFEIKTNLNEKELEAWRDLIESAGLTADKPAERTLLVYDEGRLIATGGRDGCVLKFIAVDKNRRGEDITATLLTELRRDAFDLGYSHLFLYTKPENRYTFENLFFYEVAQTDNVLFMENVRGGIQDFLDSLPNFSQPGEIGAIIMNCNPFTNGHKALIKRAAEECERVFVFVLSEDKSEFSAEDRIEMVKLGTQDMPNVTVLPGSHYIISSATFPTYFLKNRDTASTAACEVDVEIFCRRLAPRLSITRRYVGTEPTSPLTAMYNAELKKVLPKCGISVCEIERVCHDGKPISASDVREKIKKGDTEGLSNLIPKTTLDYLLKKDYV